MSSRSSDAAATLKSSKDILSSVPLAICSLGQVMLTVSSVADKSINNPPIGGFKHIEHPDSLRSTLMQISSVGKEALFSVHLGMSTINFCCNEIEKTCKEAERIIPKATPENRALVENNLISCKLENIERTTKIAQEESEKVVEALEKFLELVEETSKACSDSKTARERLQEENQKKEKELLEKKKVAEGEKLRKEKEKEEYEEQLENKKEEQDNALEAIPKPWAYLKAYAYKAICDKFGIECENNEGRLLVAQFNMAMKTREKAEEKCEQARKEVNAKFFEILDVYKQLIRLDLKKVSYDDVLEMLQEAVEFITRLLTHWRQLQERFQSLNYSIQLQLGETLDQLTSSQSDRCLTSEDILALLKSTSQQSYEIGCFGEFYEKILSEYVIPAVGALNECLIAYDPEKIGQVRKELTENAKKAHESIMDAIEKEEELTLQSKMKAEEQKIQEQLTITDDK